MGLISWVERLLIAESPSQTRLVACQIHSLFHRWSKRLNLKRGRTAKFPVYLILDRNRGYLELSPDHRMTFEEIDSVQLIVEREMRIHLVLHRLKAEPIVVHSFLLHTWIGVCLEEYLLSLNESIFFYTWVTESLGVRIAEYAETPYSSDAEW